MARTYKSIAIKVFYTGSSSVVSAINNDIHRFIHHIGMVYFRQITTLEVKNWVGQARLKVPLSKPSAYEYPFVRPPVRHYCIVWFLAITLCKLSVKRHRVIYQSQRERI